MKPAFFSRQPLKMFYRVRDINLFPVNPGLDQPTMQYLSGRPTKRNAF
jgi:hypothetical protein